MESNDNDPFSIALFELAGEVGLTDKHWELRKSVLSRVNTAISGNDENHDACVEIFLYGSSLTGAGLKECNLDIYLKSSDPQVMVNAFKKIKKQSDQFTDVQENFWKTPARFHFRDIESNLICTITYNVEEALQLSILIRSYFSMNRRALILATCFRYWAKVCEIDRENEGTLNACCYSLMLIHFLQIKYVLPVLDGSKNMTTWSGRNKDSLSKLWIDLLRYYKFYLEEKTFVVCIDTLSQKKKPDSWKSHAFAIADPLCMWKNLAYKLSKKVMDYFKNCFHVSFEYFDKMQKQQKAMPDNGCDINVPQSSLDGDTENENSSTESNQNCYESDDVSEDDDYSIEDDDNDGISDFSDIDASEKQDSSNDYSIIDISDVTANESQENLVSSLVGLRLEDNLRDKNAPELLAKEECLDDSCTNEGLRLLCFDKLHLCGEAKRPVVCCICKRKGHSPANCPDKKFKIRDLSPLSKKSAGILNDVCKIVTLSSEYSKDEIILRSKNLQKLQTYIRMEYPRSRLSLFGSSHNGFGFRDSDMDICMEFDGKSACDINPKSLIVKIGELLRRCEFVENVSIIKHARVPITKFTFKNGAIDADISLYNLLGLENTKLLLAYCKIDERLKLLGYTIKFFAKACNICDASRGTLSSYAYIIMLIHFLQQRRPAVLPVLQELYVTKSEKPCRLVEGWNVWFFDEVEELSSVWSDYGKNQESVGELWFEFFRYYIEEFDFKNNVVSIRQKSPLRKFEKSWNRFSMAIEDPFNLEHNLAAGITPKVFTYMFKILINARELYSIQCKQIDYSQFGKRSVAEIFFDISFLVQDLNMPQDRLCKKCGKIGHTRKQCILKKTQIEHNKSKERETNNKTAMMDEKHDGKEQRRKGYRKQWQKGRKQSSSSSLSNTEARQSHDRSCTIATVCTSRNLANAEAVTDESANKNINYRPRKHSREAATVPNGVLWKDTRDDNYKHHDERRRKEQKKKTSAKKTFSKAKNTNDLLGAAMCHFNDPVTKDVPTATIPRIDPSVTKRNDEFLSSLSLSSVMDSAYPGSMNSSSRAKNDKRSSGQFSRGRGSLAASSRSRGGYRRRNELGRVRIIENED